MVRCSQRCTERGTSHGITTLARCGRDSRGGPAPRLQVDGGHAPCRVRRLVRGCARGARLQRRTERGTSHQLATLARCRVRHLVRASVRGARLQRGTEHGTSHGIATDVRCGREARGGPAPRLPADGSHAPSRVRHPVRGCVCGARLQRRTGHGTSHRLATLAPCRARRPVRGCVRGARLQRRTERGTSHRIATLAPCGREARGGPAPRLPAVPTARPRRDTRCPGPPAGPATVVDTPWPP